MVNYSDNILQAMDLLIESALQKAKFDKTIQVKIKSRINKSTGEYLAEYQGAEIRVYDSPSAKLIEPGEIVYVKVPNGDMSSKKIIQNAGEIETSAVTPDDPTGTGDVNDILQCLPISDNILSYNSSLSIGLMSGHTYTLQIYPNTPTNMQKINVDVKALEDFLLKDTNILEFGAFFKTKKKLETYVDSTSEYGIAFNFITENNTVAQFKVSSRNINGTRNNISNPLEVKNTENLNNIKLIKLDSIYAFVKGFTGAKEGAPSPTATGVDIQITLPFIKLYTTNNSISTTGRDVLISSENGFVFSSTSKGAKKLEPIVYEDGKKLIVNSKEQILTYKWSIEDPFVEGGRRIVSSDKIWEVNKSTIYMTSVLAKVLITSKPTEDLDNIVNDTTGSYTSEQKIMADSKRKNNTWTLEKGVYLYNTNKEQPYKIVIQGQKNAAQSITVTADTQADIALEVLTSEGKKPANNELFIWGIRYPGEMQAKYDINKVSSSNAYMVNAKEIENFVYYECFIGGQKDNKQLLGTAEVRIENAITYSRFSVQLSNGSKIFKYGADGRLSTSTSQLGAAATTGLIARLIDNTKTDKSEDSPQSKYVAEEDLLIGWFLPKDNTTSLLDVTGIKKKMTLIENPTFTNWKTALNTKTDSTQYKILNGIKNINSLVFPSSLVDENRYGFYVPTDGKNISKLPYSIAELYSSNKVNNDIYVLIYNKNNGVIYNNMSVFTFLKDGQVGTNGTDYVCRILTNLNNKDSDKIPYVILKTSATSSDGITQYSSSSSKLCNENSTTGRSLNTTWSAESWGNPPFRVEVQYQGTTLKCGKDYEVKWSMLGGSTTGIYSGTHTHFKIAPLNDKSENSNVARFGVILNAWRDQQSDLVEGNDGNYNIIDIIKCDVTIKSGGKHLYTYLPIPTIVIDEGLSNTYQLSMVPNTGYGYVTYSSAGTNPQYDNNPFEVKVKKNNVDVTATWNEEQQNNPSSKNHFTWSLSSWSKNTFTSALGQVKDTSGKEEVTKTLYYQSTVTPKDALPSSTNYKYVYRLKLRDNGNVIGVMMWPLFVSLNRYGIMSVNGWDGISVDINEKGKYILAPQIGAGSKDINNTFTGIIMGEERDSSTPGNDIGLFGYSNGVRSIFLNAKNGAATFGTATTGQIKIVPGDHAVIHSQFIDLDGTELSKKKVEDLKPLNIEIKESNKNAKGLLIDFTKPEIRYGTRNFTVDSKGILTAHGAKIYGEIHASSLTLLDNGKNQPLQTWIESKIPTIPSDNLDWQKISETRVNSTGYIYRAKYNKTLTKDGKKVTYYGFENKDTITYYEYDNEKNEWKPVKDKQTDISTTIRYYILDSEKVTLRDGVTKHTDIPDYETLDYFIITNVGQASSSQYVTISNRGLLQASNAIIHGTIYANEGQIAGWEITKYNNNYPELSSKVYNDDNSLMTYVGMRSGKAEYCFWAGTNEQASKAQFSVTRQGKLKATGAEIAGKITAESGKIGDWTIEKGLIAQNLSITPESIKIFNQTNENDRKQPITMFEANNKGELQLNANNFSLTGQGLSTKDAKITNVEITEGLILKEYKIIIDTTQPKPDAKYTILWINTGASSSGESPSIPAGFSNITSTQHIPAGGYWHEKKEPFKITFRTSNTDDVTIPQNTICKVGIAARLLEGASLSSKGTVKVFIIDENNEQVGNAQVTVTAGGGSYPATGDGWPDIPDRYTANISLTKNLVITKNKKTINVEAVPNNCRINFGKYENKQQVSRQFYFSASGAIASGGSSSGNGGQIKIIAKATT